MGVNQRGDKGGPAVIGHHGSGRGSPADIRKRPYLDNPAPAVQHCAIWQRRAGNRHDLFSPVDLNRAGNQRRLADTIRSIPIPASAGKQLISQRAKLI